MENNKADFTLKFCCIGACPDQYVADILQTGKRQKGKKTTFQLIFTPIFYLSQNLYQVPSHLTSVYLLTPIFHCHLQLLDMVYSFVDTW